MQPMLTQRREGAKKAYQSKSSVPSLDLSGLAPLRETSAIQGRNEFFTLRRQAAKKAFQSKSTIPFLDLSGLASSRELSTIRGREKFFTLRREGAKEASESKHRSSSRNLSVSASLREPSAIQNSEKFFTLRHKDAKRRSQSKHQRFFGHTIGDALNAVLDQVFAEVNKEAKSFIHQPQIGQDLFAVDRIERGDRFHFHDHAVVDDQVGAEAFVERDPIPCDRNRDLSLHRVAAFAQFMRERDFVNNFEDAWPEPGVQAVGSVDDHSRDFIFFRAAKPELLHAAYEAKNLSALASLREISGAKYVSRLSNEAPSSVSHIRRKII